MEKQQLQGGSTTPHRTSPERGIQTRELEFIEVHPHYIQIVISNQFEREYKLTLKGNCKSHKNKASK